MRTEKQILNECFNLREKKEKKDYKKIYKIMKKVIIENDEFYKEILMKYILN